MPENDYILSDDADGVEETAWMHPLLARVQDLSLYVLAQTEHTSRARKQFQFLLTHTSPLEGLQVGSWQGDTSDDTEHHLDLAAITADWDKTCDLPKLGWLDFIAVDLDPEANGSSTTLTLSSLKTSTSTDVSTLSRP